jgi:cellulose synthase/poly-beta-1,6-N-acetylglucosamine synthase-like glycosyltransferase
MLLGYGILIDYYRRSWNKIPLFDINASPGEKNIAVTIIVPARNEEKNIGNCLASLLQQSYPHEMMQIIVVNDHSTDRTVELVESFNSPCITLINLREYISTTEINAYKKKAIEIAIEKSSGELIVTTDADCIAPPDWIKSIVLLYAQQKAAFIAAPVKVKDRNSLLSIFQSLDFITMQGITGAAVYKKIYPMCNGANLAYSKIAFLAVDGFEGINTIASGDDMLLMQKISRKFPEKIFFLKSTEAIVSTQPAPDWKSFLNQRIRWSSKADKYDNRKIFLTLLFVYIFNLCLLFFLVAAFWNIQWLLVFIMLITGKAVVEFWFVHTVAVFFGQGQLMRYFFFLQPLHIVYIIIAGTLGKFGTYEWKNRKVK